MGAFALASKSALLLAVLCLATWVQPGGASAEATLTTLYNFAGNDGAEPTGRLIFDKSGALYGSTAVGGAAGSIINGSCVSLSACGTVFKLTPPAKKDGVWTETVLHAFDGNVDGYFPLSGLIFDDSGALYGTASSGPDAYGYGTVFKLTPPSTTGGIWTMSVLHIFTGSDGIQPYVGSLISDKSGALYGTTNEGGAYTVDHRGTVFKLTPPARTGGAWTETVLHSFTGDEGVNPPSGVIFDKSGALYGTTQAGGYGYGTAFKLTPPSTTGGIWTLSVLHSFTQNEGYPSYGDLVFDKSGALYGATLFGGTFGHGMVFKLAPPAKADGVWTETILHSFTGNDDGAIPYDGLISDTSGALYGTTSEGGAYGYGTVFKLATGMTFAGTPGEANCHGKSVSALAQQYGGLDAAAAALGYSSVQVLQNAITAYCAG